MLTKSELEIMELLWQEDEPLTSSQIIDMSVNRSWKKSYVHLLINSLLDKEMIEIVGFIKTTKNYARTFKAKMSKEEYSVNRYTSMRSFQQSDIPKMLSALIKKTDDPALIKQLEDMIEAKKIELQK
ncbi:MULTISPECIES: BlaI/MecI/CopY family transcriptional regulator [unclassified Ruminococcus]|uniref:BlaI/MecI/CopY family transcriptional regulator n=1 Tax=unclassified Ruminococcus TaxID=2608920 RepID=UPI00210CC6F6|nr:MULTISPECIES: BlaI/MecI/CopY family transcriptional regulator [unclassified Ruminococcus]